LPDRLPGTPARAARLLARAETRLPGRLGPWDEFACAGRFSAPARLAR
jgi:hypothetical protein